MSGASSSAWTQEQKPPSDLVWHDIREYGIEGQAWRDTEHPFDRLPARAKGVVRDSVWDLSKNSAGLCVRFVTDAARIEARWTLTSSNLAMDHMAATGVSGLDLYVNDGGAWHWCGVGIPQSGQTNQFTLADCIPPGRHQFMLYLPLYNGVSSVEIGLPTGCTVEKAPPYPPERAKPILFYGTSITQGGCASRPGMAYPAILGRKLGRHTINLGFSGNGTMDPEVVALLTELDAAAYVIDCAPNMTTEQLTERTEPLVETLRKARPDAPIVLVECIRIQSDTFLPAARKGREDKNAALRGAYDRLMAKAVTKLYYIPCDHLYGDDGEATVDGAHATDLGFLRIADAMEPTLRQALEGSK